MNVALTARAVALGAAVLFAASAASLAAAHPAAMDFIAQYAAAKLVAAGQGSAMLDPAAVLAAEHAASPERTALLPFVQPPAIALLLAPLASLPFETAFIVMAAIDAAMILIAIAIVRPSAGALGVVLLALAPPAVLAVAQGQTSPLILLLAAVASRAGPVPGGLSLGLTALRPQTAPLLILAGLADPARRIWTIAGTALVVLASALVVGIDGVVRYAAVLSDASLWSVSGELGLGRAIGWSGLAVPIGFGTAGLVVAAVGLIVGAVAVLRAAPSDRARIAAAWSLVASPHVLMHDGLLAYPAIVAMATRRAFWDAASVAAWLVHLALAPVAVLWSLMLAFASSYPRRGR